jgi:hypothetical protein
VPSAQYHKYYIGIGLWSRSSRVRAPSVTPHKSPAKAAQGKPQSERHSGCAEVSLLRSYCNRPWSDYLHMLNNPGRIILAGSFADF